MILTNLEDGRKYDVFFKRSGGNEAAICPACAYDRKKKQAKSLSFDHEKNVGKCHHCGGRFVAAKKYDNMPQPKKEYVKPRFTNATALSEKVVEWFKNRGIGQQTLIDFKVTNGVDFMPQTGREERTIRFNYFRDGELVNVKYRDGRKNFKLHKDAELIFYNLDAVKGQKEITICEGEADAMSFHEVGLTNVISVPNGATRGSAKLEYLDNCYEMFENVDKVYLATDDDEAGRALRDELARRIGKEKCYIVTFNGCKDANELLVKDRLALLEVVKNAKPYPIEGIYTPKDYLSNLRDLKKNGLKAGDGISITQFNEHLTFVTGYMTLVTGIPNHGKGEVLDQIMVDLAHLHEWSFGIFSPENYPIELHISKLASKVFDKSFNQLSDKELEKFVETYDETFYMIMPDDDLSLDSVLDHARMLVKRKGIKGLVIDPWNKLDHQYDGNEGQYISRCLDKIDNFSRVYGVHTFIVAHPTKMKKKQGTDIYEVPSPYDVSGSAHWFNKCANAICVYRNFYDDGSSDTDIHVQKVKFKHWGRQGSIRTSYDVESGRYYVVGYRNRGSYLTVEEEKKTAIQANIAFEINPTVNDKDDFQYKTDEAPF